MRALLYLGVFVLYLLHNDVWLWERSERLLGLPLGLAYHVLYCVAVVGMMALLVRFAWPLESTDLEREDTPT